MAIVKTIECYGNTHYIDDEFLIRDPVERKKSLRRLYQLNVQGFFEGTPEQQEAFREKQRQKYGDE